MKKKLVKRKNSSAMYRGIGPEEFLEVLHYYDVDVNDRGQMLCPFHNDHNLGNCSINPKNRKRLKCFACGADVDAVEFVVKKEGFRENWQARDFIWTQILGRQPIMELDDVTAPRLSPGDYKFIGLEGLSHGPYGEPPIQDVRGAAERGTRLPEGMVFFKNLQDVESDLCPYGYRLKSPSANELMESDPDLFFTMLENKANEKMAWFIQLRNKARGLDGTGEEPPKLKLYALLCSRLLEPAFPGITRRVMPMVARIWEDEAEKGIARVNEIAGKIRRMEQYYRYRRKPQKGIPLYT